ncbi:MAG: glycosyltransferase family 4 protein [Oscillospiraceae bacterium]|nr:glycosyltransferase family 4 protein [Oscillospiraceae bacterium]
MEKLIRVAFLSTYPPRECGIATFTQDLFRELQKNCGLQTGIIAVNDQDYVYGKDVIQEFPQQDRASYTKLADWVNRSAIQVIVIEHEYGIYGGECGEYLLDFAERVQKPFVLTLHTVLPNPSEKQKQILQELCKKSSRIVTMASNSQKILCNLYGADAEKITVIPHGVPVFEVPSREELKKQQNLEGRTIVSTFGLISSGKGLEYGIRAIADVAEKHPDILYLILGQTHPVVKKREGEAYRESLEKLVNDLGLQQNVRFVNRYLEKEELVRYLKMSDIYMTPYLGKEQAVSGTLAYAAGYGRVIVSTPYLYAEEMLSDGRGMLADFRDAESLGRCINYLIDHPNEKAEMEQKTLELGRTMSWKHVADRYTEIFKEVARRS